MRNRKLFVSSRKLGAGGFAQGTAAMLHEIAHELGDEDSPAFMNRLARLIGAAIRDPSAVAAARARFERDLPPGRRIPEPPSVEPYKPPFGDAPGATAGSPLLPNVYVSPGFPPTTALLERLHEAAAAAGFACYPCVIEVWSSADARRLKVHGIPSVACGDEPVEIDAAQRPAAPGLRLRTYGPERRVLPSVEMVTEALGAHTAKMRAWTRPSRRRSRSSNAAIFMARVPL